MNRTDKSGPLLPSLLAMPSRLLPDAVHSLLITRVLNHVLAESLRDGELDFMQEHCVAISVRDAGVTFHLTCVGGRLTACSRNRAADMIIEGSAYDFLVLAGRQEDPDTLVFQRRLVLQGDTELGLQVKNFLDGLDVESLGLYQKMEPLLKRVLPVYSRVFG